MAITPLDPIILGDAAGSGEVFRYLGTSISYDGLSRRRVIESAYEEIYLPTQYVINLWNESSLLMWEGFTIIEERDGGWLGSGTSKLYFPQGEYQISNSTALYYTRDHLGSVRELIDATGAVRARYDYDPWGKRTKLSGDLNTAMGFTGHWHWGVGGGDGIWSNAASNYELIFAPFRAYDPAMGRWINCDPIREAGRMNMYGYVLNNPVNLWDPLGLQPGGQQLVRPLPLPDPSLPRIPPIGPVRNPIDECISAGKDFVGGVVDGMINIGLEKAARTLEGMADLDDLVADAYDALADAKDSLADPFMFTGGIIGALGTLLVSIGGLMTFIPPFALAAPFFLIPGLILGATGSIFFLTGAGFKLSAPADRKVARGLRSRAEDKRKASSYIRRKKR